uniref:Uncharacterized protein n=1 Tax=Nelumbo nucifera TaxID=4432 RepID=A0A822ZEN3_NELNU|nr:TPA_asm: hypothetical protein HUJ06_015789 [Nelumbo nucifera]
MKLWDKMRLPLLSLWLDVSTRLGIRKSGIFKLRHEVRTCEYEDVQVMWEMLKRNNCEIARTPTKKRKRPFWKRKVFRWPRHSPLI